jgi:hypothetical protein
VLLHGQQEAFNRAHWHGLHGHSTARHDSFPVASALSGCSPMGRASPQNSNPATDRRDGRASGGDDARPRQGAPESIALIDGC